MSGTLEPDENGEVRVGVPPGLPGAAMAALLGQMLAKVEEQLGGEARFVRTQPAADGSEDHELVFVRAE